MLKYALDELDFLKEVIKNSDKEKEDLLVTLEKQNEVCFLRDQDLIMFFFIVQHQI